MAKNKIKIQGLKELQKALKNLPKEAKKVIRKELRVTAKEFQKDLKADFEEDTGELKKSIKVRAAKRSRKRIGVETKIDSVYSGNIEFGTENIEGRASGRTSFNKNAPQEAKDLEIRLKKGIEIEANKLGRNRPRIK